MKKRILTILLSFIAFLNLSANYTQQVQIGTDKGLSCDAVRTFARDIYGRLWVGTVNGADMISNGIIRQYQYFTVDGNDIVAGDVQSIGCSRRAIIATTHHIIDFDPDNDSTSIVTYDGRNIRTEFIMMRGDSAFFFNMPLGAVMMYDLNTCTTRIVAQFPSERQFHFTKILQVSNDPNQLLLVEDERGFYHLDITTGALTHLENLGEGVISRAAFIDSKDILWIAYRDKGISGYYVKSGFDLIAHFDRSNSEIPENNIICLSEMPDGSLFTCSPNNGICILNRKTGKAEDDFFKQIPPMHVFCAMSNETENEIILGTLHRGIITLKKSFFHNLNNTVTEHDTESTSIPISGYQESDGTIWFGSGGFGISRFDEEKEVFTQFQATDGMRIAGICQYDENNLLITERTQGLFLFNKRRGTISEAKFLSDAGINISSSRLTNLKTLTTPDGDIMLFNCNGRHLIYRRNIKEVTEIVLQMNGEENRGVVEDVKMYPSHATVVCNGCIYEIDYRTLLARLIFQNQEDGHSAISRVVEDSRGIIWACSPDELISYDPRANKLSRVMDKKDYGVFLSMAIDLHDHLWITTDKSFMIMFDTNNKEFQETSAYYGRDCGTMLNFMPGFSLVSDKGLVYFPNTSGLIVIDPNDADIRFNSDPYPLALTKIVLDGTIYESHGVQNKPLSLPNKFSLLGVHVALNQFDPTRPVSLKYTLIKKGRLYPVMEVVTTNTELSIPRFTHGSYTLSVSQHTIQGWSEPQNILSYNVARPFIMTVPAYLLIIAIIISISVTISKVGISLKQIDMDRAINAQENKHKDDKISLLSNLAHELRTPLSLIYNPVKDMLEEKSVKGIDYDRLERIFNQVQKMTEMVNTILDKGTSDINRSDIVIEQVDLNEWIGKIIEDFKIDCYAKGLKTQFEPMSGLGRTGIDVKMVETAVNNIMTNAIKYSDTGTITISTGHDKGMIWIKFHDEGRGFTCKPEELFKRYYRENENIPGYGLGLSHAKLLIELLDGNIKAEKNVGPGSTFTIEIPDDLSERFGSTQSMPQPQAPVMSETTDFGTIEETSQNDEVYFDTKSMTLLIVDDQDDILQFIKDEYSQLFKTIYTAHDGKEALDIIRQRMPNVVVSDIMMPRMNGFELCKTIKTDLELSSIPVILLTSRSDPKNQDMGYKMGADSFLPKPFDSKLLYKIIRSQLKNRFEIKRQYATSFFTAISEDQTFSAADEQFVLKLNRFIRENLSNTMLGVDMIVDHMNVSRTTLFNKMNNLVGASTNKYIRRIRIDVAKDLLSKTNKSVGTIAEETGFSESQYFSTVFKQETGMTPSQFKDSLRKV